MIHGGLLGVRGNSVHEIEMESNGIKPIDLVVINLYAFDGLPLIFAYKYVHANFCI
jgi:AICAR transformylase/IMP cyclohydrolase PurH